MVRDAAKATDSNAESTQHALGKQQLFCINLSTFKEIKLDYRVHRQWSLLCDSALFSGSIRRDIHISELTGPNAAAAKGSRIDVPLINLLCSERPCRRRSDFLHLNRGYFIP